MAEDAGLDLADGNLEPAITGPVSGDEQRGFQTGQDPPVAVEIVNRLVPK
jgi:hypothetical protein